MQEQLEVDKDLQHPLTQSQQDHAAHLQTEDAELVAAREPLTQSDDDNSQQVSPSPHKHAFYVNHVCTKSVAHLHLPIQNASPKQLLQIDVWCSMLHGLECAPSWTSLLQFLVNSWPALLCLRCILTSTC